MMRTFMLSCCVLLLLAAPASAERPASTTVEGALQNYFSEDTEDRASAVLTDSGFVYERMLVAELLPSEVSLFVEVELRRDALRFRYPLKLERKRQEDTSTWRVEWAPNEDYARALVALGDVEMLAPVGAESALSDMKWADIERLPALPVLVAEQAIVTPFGHVAEPPSGRAKDDAELVPPKKLVEHAQSWVGLVTEDEPGTANVDLVVARGASWRRVTQALMAPAAVGLFRIYLVGSAEGSLVGLPVVAPVVGQQTPDGVEPLVVGMYPSDGQDDGGDERAFRVRIGEELVEPPSDGADLCAEGMTLCSESAEAFGRQASEHIAGALEDEPTKIGYVMFAATGDFSVEEVVVHLQALGAGLGIPPEKMLVGFIADERSDAEQGEQSQ